MGIRPSRGKPTYSLDDAKRLAKEGKVLIATRPRAFITNRTGRSDLRVFVDELFEALEPGDFYKTEELRALPGVWADIYCPVPFIEPESGESNDWYIKFFIEDGTVRLHILSANYNGYIH